MTDHLRQVAEKEMRSKLKLSQLEPEIMPWESSVKMLSSVALLALAACAAAPVAGSGRAPQAATASSAPQLVLEPYTFVAADGTKVDAEKGAFEVPENRSAPNSRKIKISFVRFKSTSPNPGDPIVYLAGGPGAPGTLSLTGGRFPLTMALREVADVIAYDQRGTGTFGGLSNALPPCNVEQGFDFSKTVSRAILTQYVRDEVSRCFGWWEKQGVDIDGYTTLENAEDVEDLRRVLGARKVNLWGIS